MAKASNDYIRSIIPKNLPSGIELLEEGRRKGKSIIAGRSRLVRESKYDSYLELFREQAKVKDIQWISQIGLPTVDETVEGLKELKRWVDKLEINLNFALTIPSTLQAIPKQLRKYNIKSTSYLHDSPESYIKFSDIAGMEIMQGDQVLGVPNSWETGMNVLRAGSYQTGCISQLMWNHPNCEEHEKYVCEMLLGMGVLSSKYDEGFGISGYMDDGFPSYCKDAIAYVAWAMFEQYIATDLCGVRYTVGYGGLLSDTHIKAALLKALYDKLVRDDQPPVLFLHANTTQYWDHDIEANYGMLAQELLMCILAERRYGTGAMIMPIPVTEKVHVPTVEAIKNALGMATRLEENIEQWESVVDFTKIDSMAEELKVQGERMYRNLLDTLDFLGYDIKDPLHLLMFIKKFDAGLFEETFHPDIDKRKHGHIRFYTDMGKLTKSMVEETVKCVQNAGLQNALKGKRILLASADTHIYGVHYAKAVLEAAGAQVIEGGTDSSVKYVFDIADEEDIKYIGISTHNGQAFGIAGQIIEELEERDGEYVPFIGGVLNTVLPGHSQPSDVKQMINDRGVFAENDLVETIRMISKINC